MTQMVIKSVLIRETNEFASYSHSAALVSLSICLLDSVNSGYLEIIIWRTTSNSRLWTKFR